MTQALHAALATAIGDGVSRSFNGSLIAAANVFANASNNRTVDEAAIALASTFITVNNVSGAMAYLESAAGIANVAAGAYDSASTALFNAMTTPPTTTRKSQINAVIAGLKADGVWASGDCLQVYAAADEQAASLNWINPAAFTMTKVGSPAFTANKQYSTNGSSSALSVNYNPGTQAINYAQDSVSFGFWSFTSGTNSGSVGGEFDGTDGTFINPRDTNGRLNAGANQVSANASQSAISSISNGSGFSAFNRSGATSLQMYKQGVAITINTNPSQASTGVNSTAFELGRVNGTFRSHLFGAVWIGGSLDATKHLALYNRLQTYMTALGN